MKTGEEASYPVTNDICGYRQEGFGLLDSTVFQGKRWSAARAYLDPAQSRSNLTEAMVERVLIQNGQATSVLYRDRRGRQVKATAGKEVILSAGAVGSPHILMLSGIGPGAHLRDMASM